MLLVVKSSQIMSYTFLFYFIFILFHSNGGQRERREEKNKLKKIHMYKTKRARNTLFIPFKGIQEDVGAEYE